MTTQVLKIAWVPLLAFAIASLALPLVKRVACHFKIVATPLSDTHGSTPLLGGTAIIGAIVATLAVARALPGWMCLGAGGLFAIGLVDDAIALRPARKFMAQTALVLAVVALGPRFGLAPWPLVSASLAAFFLLSTVNAFNLIDGLDGLAAGVGILAAAAISTIGLLRGDYALACGGLAIAGGLGGFLVSNLHPASIFMGDCGALPLGLLLGAVSLQAGGLAATNSRLSRYIVPILIMMVPLLDTAIVSVSRMATGNPVSRRGLDHSHHRLLALGLSHQCAVSVVWSVAALTAGCAVLLAAMPHAYVVATLPLVAAVFGLVGLFMIDLTFDSEPPGIAYGYMQGLARLILTLSYKRRITEGILDLVLITAAYFGAWLIRLDFRIGDGLVMALLASAPWVIAATYAAFFALGIYRGIWRYAGFSDVIRFAMGPCWRGSSWSSVRLSRRSRCRDRSRCCSLSCSSTCLWRAGSPSARCARAWHCLPGRLIAC